MRYFIVGSDFGKDSKYGKQARECAVPGVERQGATAEFLTPDAGDEAPWMNAGNKGLGDGSDHVTFLHPDLEFLEGGWAERCQEVFDRDPKVMVIGVIGAKGHRGMKWWEAPERHGWVHHKVGKPGVDFDHGDHEVDTVDGMVFAIRGELAHGYGAFGKGYRWPAKDYAKDCWHAYIEELCAWVVGYGYKVYQMDFPVRHHTDPGYAGGEESWKRADLIYRKRWEMPRWENTVIVISQYGKDTRRIQVLHASMRLSEDVPYAVVSDATPDHDIGSRLAILGEGGSRWVSRFYTPGTKHPETMDRAIRKMSGGGRPFKFIAQANDDVVLPPGWLEHMGREWVAIEGAGYKIGMLGASSNYVSGPQRRVLNPFDPSQNRVFMSPRVVPFFAIHRVDDYLRVGGYDVSNPTNLFGDDQLSLAFLRGGLTNWVSTCFVTHFGSQSLKASGVDQNDEMRLGREWMDTTYPGWLKELGREIG